MSLVSPRERDVTYRLLHLLGILLLHALQTTVGIVEQLLDVLRVLLLQVEPLLLEARHRLLQAALEVLLSLVVRLLVHCLQVLQLLVFGLA